MGSSSNKAEDENHINNGVESDADVVVVYLADAGRIAVAHKCKRACGKFPWAHTHGWTEGDPLAQKGKCQCSHCKKSFSSKTNYSGWKAHHLSSKHGLSLVDGWSNHNLKGFYVVIVHSIDIVMAKSKSLLLIIINITNGHGVGVRVAKALFEHLKGM
ncbi:unnamed protein product [Sphagnum tenellum]